MFFLNNTLKFLFSHPLSSSKPWKALRNFVHWQLHSRLGNQSLSAFVFRFVENTNIIIRGGETGATGNIYVGLHEFVDMCLILHFLSKDDLFFDIGANIGSYSLLAGGVSNAAVIALEPVSNTFDKLIENIGINNLHDQVKCLQYAVGSSISQGLMSTDAGCQNKILSDSTTNKDNTELVNITTIDELSKTYGFPTAIKIDVEGYEEYAFAGALETLNNQTLSLIVIEGVSQALHDLLTQSGFIKVFYNPYTREILSNPSASLKPANNIYIRNQKVHAKLAQSPAYFIHNMDIRI
jgi:FkbM family methyltransferase